MFSKRRFMTSPKKNEPLTFAAKPLLPGLLDAGEVLHLIAPPQCKASWLMYDLALSFVARRPWLGLPTPGGRILYIDFRLHPETSLFRIREVTAARGIDLEAVLDCLFIDNLRGGRRGTVEHRGLFSTIGDPLFSPRYC